MKNRLLLVLLTMVLVLSLVAFGACKAEEAEPPPPPPPPVEEEEEPPPPPPPPEEVWEWPDKLVMGALDVGGSDYAGMLAWTTPLAEDTGITIRVAAEGNQLKRYTYVKKNIHFTAAISGLKYMFEANNEWAVRDSGPWPARAFWISSVAYSGFAVAGDSDIKTPHDIKPGTKMGYFTFAGPLGRLVLEALLAWGNVDPDDVEWVPIANIAAAAQALIDGKADIIFAYPATPTNYEIEASPRGLAWIEMNMKEDPEGAIRHNAVFPVQGFSPCGFGVPSAIGVSMVATISPYPVRASDDTELIYHLAKWMDENFDKYKDAFPQSVTQTIDNVLIFSEVDFVPLHDGTVKYLKEKGLWTDAHEKRRQQQIELIDQYIEAYQTAIDTADEKEINVNPTNEEWLELWTNYKKELGLPPFLFFLGLD
jgi:hypothetical protein